jgi:hypothetical protein
VTEKMWMRREALLAQAMKKCGSPQELNEKWFKIDLAFKRHIVMARPDECKKRFFSDELIIISNPSDKKVA